MKLFVFVLLTLFNCANALSDELYEFHRIRCTPEFSEILVEPVSFYNIGDAIWPSGTSWWADHVAAMKRLEQKDGLYVFGQLYGYYDQKPISIQCGKSKLVIEYKKGTFTEPGSSEGTREYRTNPSAKFYFDGELFSAGVYLNSYGITRLRIYSQSDGGGIIDACVGSKCEWLSPFKEPLGPKDYQRALEISDGN